MDTFKNFSTILKGWFETHDIPERLQRKLFEKIRDDVFDAGDSFSLAMVTNEESEESLEVSQGESDGEGETELNECDNNDKEYVLLSTRDLQAKEDIWLVDHCCTFRLRGFREHLEANEELRKRLARILSLTLSNNNVKEDTQSIFDHMWKKVGSYRLGASADSGDSQYDSYWFIHDEVGSAIRVITDEPGNMKLEPMPVCFPEKGAVFSVMWCIEDMEEGTIATRKAVSVLETADAGGKEALEIMYETENGETYVEAKKTCVESWQRLVNTLEKTTSVDKSFSKQSTVPLPVITEVENPLRVFTDSELVSVNLTDTANFVLIDLPEEADVVWISHDLIENPNDFQNAKYISQFPEERIFTSKQGLLKLIQNNLGYVDWYQVGYDTVSQLREFIGDYMVREARLKGGDITNVVSQEHIRHLRNEDGTNLWITKPVNLARSIDMTISSNFDALVKAAETGPKVVCKYIANTATLRGRKFDLRFIVAVRSFFSEQTPLEAYVYNVFWTRFALEDYALDEFDCYEKHWTVMNYANPEKLVQLHDQEFIKELNNEYAAKGYGFSIWEGVVCPKILKMLHEVLGAVEVKSTGHNRCRAIYGIDVMLRETICANSGEKTLEPSLLEITYAPDCRRACKYHPDFFNDVFRTLFLGTPSCMTRLSGPAPPTPAAAFCPPRGDSVPPLPAEAGEKKKKKNPNRFPRAPLSFPAKPPSFVFPARLVGRRAPESLRPENLEIPDPFSKGAPKKEASVFFRCRPSFSRRRSMGTERFPKQKPPAARREAVRPQ
ncbi:Tubulin-tyrosine ligase/Tubulin polyglutamylase [Trypanosoma melophagium]|uniref:Tubulin-tyrosine ligase/Tubulin polyglutamylase n=1 Tax=Trypanosoma melophagium TaxID=715481 RepID=UPI00351A4899|nr:Tubulin-tyrosine ligase/Tubulin polyglutamylase [Trypanosoma melophagium]